MYNQDSNRPDLSVFALALILVLGVACAMGAGGACQSLTGLVLIGGGGWAIFKIGRWALSQFGSNRSGPMY